VKPDYTDAIHSLCPTAQWVLRGQDLSTLDWHSPTIPRPTDAEIEAELARLIAAWDAAQYRRDREQAYPSLEAILVALWEQVIEGRPASAAQLQILREEIKQRYPKPS
jgi:hypothetical protein